MPTLNRRLLGFSVFIVVSLSAAAADGPLRSELSLGGYTMAIVDPGAPSASAPGRVRIGQLETNVSLRVGDTTIGKRDPAGVRYDVWLESINNGSQLQFVEPSDATTGQPVIAGRVALNAPDLKVGPATPFVAALLPETGSSARLVLRWGNYEAATPVALVDPPRRARTAETPLPNTTVSRTHDEDTSVLSRARLLAQRNETALVLANGRRLSVSFQRSFGKAERGADGGGGVRTRGLSVDGPDFARLSSTADRAVVLLTQSAVPRLSIESPLRFGRTLIVVGNQVPGFPGSYGLWLKRAGNSWRLVFNNEPDAWGSQHDPKFDAAEIELKHSESGDASRPFAVALVPTAADRGRLLVIWGPHEWSAEFIVAG